MLGGPTSNMSCCDWGRDSESCRLFYLCPNLGRFLLRNNSFFKSQYFKPCNEFKRLSILVQNPAGTFSARHICSQSFEHYCAREQDVQQVHQKRTQRMLITLLFFGHVSHNHLVISDFFFFHLPFLAMCPTRPQREYSVWKHCLHQAPCSV